MKTYQDLLTRAGWTLAQSGLAILATSLADVPAWWALPVATALSAVKTWVVNHNKATPGGAL
jgi:hypothetical protein